LWLVLRHLQKDKEHRLHELGFKLRVGDIMKFGRVRYKVLMMNSSKTGLKEFQITDRLQKEEFEEELRKQNTLEGSTKKRKKK